MKRFPNWTGTFQRIQLSIARNYLNFENLQRTAGYSFWRQRTTVVLCLVNGATVSLDGHYSIDYYDHSAPPVPLATQPA